jgi:hypothetical protein
VIVSSKKELIEQFNEGDGQESGRLFGYPETAVQAFIDNDCMDFDSQDRLQEAAGLPEYMPVFRFSKKHAQEEIKVLQDWYVTLQEYGLADA